ncbi:LOW QUALITY PROTEIN: cytosolic endo-beta-N-acetylglucosaminidase 1-like [Benincasa hispida]|uniref:LOW QUALITY PROTEIN: cytosolic endo-beta-N-acetylglucosaminidase 1-like n=1 Tax=Benincasa hispida TaxID=102211 RepID=UPI001901C02A|nr:LOW QUALITY PROTEIN: cytosolic endo-beta-N-acetylglucosaminidase 1-like [Benincasa hispida]
MEISSVRLLSIEILCCCVVFVICLFELRVKSSSLFTSLLVTYDAFLPLYKPAFETLLYKTIRFHSCRILNKFFFSFTMAQQSSVPTTTTTTTTSEPPPRPLSPTEPSIPIAYPIKTLRDLESRAYFNSFHYPFNISTVPLQPAPLPDRRRILVCHDMKGGYVDDKWVQGGTNPDAYAIWHWHLIDIFVYFSHDLVTLPPPCWTNTAHRHGVKVLGTFIVEGGGEHVRDTLLSSKDSAKMYAECLAELAIALGFDGWLMNMEISMNHQQVTHMIEFVSHLTQSMHSKLPGSLVIWYDSVTVDGHLHWQNELNEKNKVFFDISDGIFVNYWWREDAPKKSVAVAGERKHEVYMGIDVFGRGTFGGGGWNTNVALDVLKRDDVSAAIFAPGWVHEHEQETDFQTAQNKWWGLVKQSWEIVRSYPKQLPFYSNFDQGHGYHVSIAGVKISDASWNNLSSQSFQPILDVTDDSTSRSIQAYSNFEVVYNGGGSIALKGTLEQNCYNIIRLFQGELALGDVPLVVIYSLTSNGDSQLGLLLEFFSSTDKRKVLLASSNEKQFSTDFSEVIETTPVEVPGLSPDWFVYMGRIQMSGYKLTNINVVCYRSSSKTSALKHKCGVVGKNNSLNCSSSSDYFAVLGNVIVRSVEEPDLPPPSSWLVKSPYVRRTTSADGTRTLDIHIVWELKDSSSDKVFERYNVYVMEVVEEGNNPLAKLHNVPKYLGVAHVKAFYASNLAIPSGISGFKFIIQVCGVDGSVQRLEDSPFLYVNVLW